MASVNIFGGFCLHMPFTDDSGCQTVGIPNCIRDPMSGDNDNGGCHTTLSSSQGGTACGALLLVGGGLMAAKGFGGEDDEAK